MSEYGEPWRINDNGDLENSRGVVLLAHGWLPENYLQRVVACINACAECTDAEVAELNDDEAVARMTGEAVVEIFDHLRTEAPPPGEIKPDERN